MLIYPAIDLYDKKVVRLYKGDYSQMTVYSDSPVDVALDFQKQGAKYLHLVDLEGAKTGETSNLEIIKQISQETSLFIEVGGGIRNIDTVRSYLNAGVNRIILGTAAVTNEKFLQEAVDEYGEKIAVGVDIKEGKVAIKGWTETSDYDTLSFCRKLQQMGIKTIICTDISKDGAMAGTNHELYQELSKELNLQIIASGGVSSLQDIRKLSKAGLYGAIIGKAYYTGAISIREAIEVAS